MPGPTKYETENTEIDDELFGPAQTYSDAPHGPLHHVPDYVNDEPDGRLARVIRRTAISRDSVVTVDEAIEFIGGRSGAVRKWLRSTVMPLKHPTGRTIFRWGDVLDAMRRASP